MSFLNNISKTLEPKIIQESE